MTCVLDQLLLPESIPENDLSPTEAKPFDETVENIWEAKFRINLFEENIRHILGV